jgi:hypothetical protein
MQAEPEDYLNSKSSIAPGEVTSTFDYKNLLQFLELGRTQLGFYEQCVSYFNERYPTVLTDKGIVVDLPLKELTSRFYIDTGIDGEVIGVRGTKRHPFMNRNVKNIKAHCAEKLVLYKNRLAVSEMCVEYFRTGDRMAYNKAIELIKSARAMVGIFKNELSTVQKFIEVSNKSHLEDPYSLERSYYYALIHENSFDEALIGGVVRSIYNLLRSEIGPTPSVPQSASVSQASLEDYVQHWVNQGIIQVPSDEMAREGSDISDGKEKEKEESNGGSRRNRRPRKGRKPVTPVSLAHEVDSAALSKGSNIANPSFESSFASEASGNLKKEYRDVSHKSKRKRRGKADVKFAKRATSKLPELETTEKSSPEIFMRKQDQVIFDRLANTSYPTKIHPDEYVNLMRSLVENNPHFFRSCRFVRSNVQMTFFFKLTKASLVQKKKLSYAVHIPHGKDGDKVPVGMREEYFGIFEVLGIDQAEIRLKAEER